MHEQIRLRKGVKLRELKIPEENLKQLKETMSSGFSSPYRRRELGKQILGTSLCSLCSGIPSVELTYDVSDKDLKATKVERYCDSCLRQVYTRIEAGEPTKSEDIAAFYGCEKVEKIPSTGPEPYIKTRKR